jgi:DNA helicase-2/ATP-dependent DNA helicase PcrA
VPDELYDPERYAGTDADERRLFYVAVTRARDLLILSTHSRTKRSAVRPSRYLELARRNVASPVGRREVHPRGVHEATLRLTFSELDSYFTCGKLFLFRSVLGFASRLAPELGYGKAVHNMMRRAAVMTCAQGEPLDASFASEIVFNDFYLPSANKAAHRTMQIAAERLLRNYLSDPSLAAELTRTWETERPFALNLEGVAIVGRADIIFRQDEAVQDLVIVDYKTASGRDDHSLQVGVYAAAALRESLPVSGGKVVDLKTTTVTPVNIAPSELAALESRILEAATSLRAAEFPPTTDPSVCGRCDFQSICVSSLAP